jgi:hypothetical protein
LLVVGDEIGRKVYRRTGAVVVSAVTVLFLLGIAVVVTVQSGEKDGLVPWAVTVPLAVLSVISGILPKLVTTASHVEVHNMFTRLVIPYQAVSEAVDGRRGVAVRILGGRAIPVVALGRSSLANAFTGNAVARRAVAEVNARISAVPGEKPPPVERQVKVPVVATLLAVVLIAGIALLVSP